jgi:DNA-binding XRE family transcriptional regulator
MQDWEPMVLNSKKSGAPEKNPQKNLTTEQKKTIELTNNTDAQKSDMMPRDIVKQLTALRASRNKTQKQLANELNIMPKIIQDIESNRHPRDMKLAQRIAKVMGGTLNK